MSTPSPSSSLAVGVFDGVHLGHQALLKTLAKYGPASVITFSTHPRSLPLLCSVDHRIALIKSFGHQVVPVTFDSIKDKTAEQFLDEWIEKGLKHFVLGYDNHIGKGRAGTPAFIQDYLEKHRVAVERMPPILEGGEPISSGRIRKLIELGDLKMVAQCLGRPWSVFGKPINGEGIGRKLGTPTLNFPLEGLVSPPFGVYTAELKSRAGVFYGVANIGVSPTLKEKAPPLFEIYLFDIETLPPPPYEVIPIQFLRPEQTFATETDLRRAIDRDKEQAQLLFHKRK